MAASMAVKLGYTNVRLYAEGMAGWEKAGLPLERENAIPRVEIPPLSTSQVLAKLDGVYVLDIRLEGLYKDGHIKGSWNIPIHLVTSRFQEIPTGKTIVVVDIQGNPSWMPIGWFLKSKGYSDVMMLKGGMNAWVKEGLPLEK
jgi:rhodanese-related sulfurtransferase